MHRTLRLDAAAPAACHLQDTLSAAHKSSRYFMSWDCSKPVSSAYKRSCHACDTSLGLQGHSTLPCSKRKELSTAVPKTTEELEVEKVMSLHAHSMHGLDIQLQPISLEVVQQLRPVDT